MDKITCEYLFEQTEDKIRELCVKALDKRMFNNSDDVINHMVKKAEEMFPTTKDSVNDTKEETLTQWKKVIDIVENEVEIYCKGKEDGKKLSEEFDPRLDIIINKCIKNFVFDTHIQVREFLLALSLWLDLEDKKLGKGYLNEGIEGARINIIKAMDILENLIEGVENFTPQQLSELKESLKEHLEIKKSK